jgi:hypothetical protein
MEEGKALREIITIVVDKIRKADAICEVISVDTARLTCKVKDVSTGYEIDNVRLLSVIEEEAPEARFAVYPKVGSRVGVSFLFDRPDLACVFKFGETDKIDLNGDQYGGLVKVNELTARLNDIESKLNELIGKWNEFCASYVPGSPASAGLPASLLTETLTSIEETSVEDLENEKVKHG